jgi:thiamine biosynthesis lipoprotein
VIRSIEFRAMNTEVLLAAEGEDQAGTGMQAVREFIDDCEQRFSRFLPASEVSELNRGAGEWVQVSDELMDMLKLAWKFHLETQGLFDPAILTDLIRVGYDRSMEHIRSAGSVSAAASPRTSRPAFKEIRLDLAEGKVRLPRGMQIDLGGIAKGWIVDKAARLLNTYTENCAVSAGGDMLFIGRPSAGADWDVYLEDPRDPTQSIAHLHRGPGAVATSSVMKRTWNQAGKARHHLIDPRTGESATTDWLSVTVLAPDIITAEVYAKAILIGGEGELPGLPGARTGLTFIAVEPDGNLTGSPGYKEFIHESTTESFAPAGGADQAGAHHPAGRLYL